MHSAITSLGRTLNRIRIDLNQPVDCVSLCSDLIPSKTFSDSSPTSVVDETFPSLGKIS